MALPVAMKGVTSFAVDACIEPCFSDVVEPAVSLKLSLPASSTITESICHKSLADTRQCHSGQNYFSEPPNRSDPFFTRFFYSPDGQVIEEREASKATELPDFPDRQHFWGADGQLLFSEHGIIDETKNWSAQENIRKAYEKDRHHSGTRR